MHNFNTKYLDLYDQLETEDKAFISVIDYVNALLPRTQIYIRITMEEYSCLEDSYSKAEKYENILQESHWRNERSLYNYNNYSSIKQPIGTFINNTNNSRNKNGMNFKNLKSTFINMLSNSIHKNNYNIQNNYNNENKMGQIQIKTCFF